jgi:hypothetical protein
MKLFISHSGDRSRALANVGIVCVTSDYLENRWSAHLPGSVSFAACACGMTRGPTSTRRSSRSDAR